MKKCLLPRIILAVVITLAYVGWMWLHAPASSPTTSGEATIGGNFTLTDTDGKPFTNELLKGKYSLVFFGFTRCPAICPTALSGITQALNLLGADAAKVTPVFVTVDPERDTPEVMKEYATHFHPSLVALTGTPEQVTQAEQAYKVYASKQPLEGSEDYTMDHSGYIYLMDKNGRYAAHFAHDIAPEDLAEALKPYLAKD